MGTVNACLKRGFIILTCIIGLISALALGLTLFGHGVLHSTEELEDLIMGIKVMYAITMVTLLLAIIGMCGAVKGKSWMLIVFSVGISLIFLILAFDFLAMLVSRNEIREMVSAEHQELWTLPLDSVNKTIVEVLYEFQEKLGCCGVEQGYQDWGDNIHPSCFCTDDVADCIPAPLNSSHTVLVYKRPCIPVFIDFTKFVLGITSAIAASILLLLSASLVLSICILVQLRRKVEVPPVYYSAEAKAGNYACLADME